MGIIKINPQRLRYLLRLFGYTLDSFMKELQKFYKHKITDDVFCGEIKLNYLKKIDKEFFRKGLSFYTDPNNYHRDSIFFRKRNINHNNII